MILKVVLNSYLGKLMDLKTVELEVEEGMTALMVLDMLNIPEDEVSVASFEGVRMDWNAPINDSGELQLFPGIIGG